MLAQATHDRRRQSHHHSCFLCNVVRVFARVSQLFQVWSEGLRGEKKHFRKPLFATMDMFIGMSMCLLLHALLQQCLSPSPPHRAASARRATSAHVAHHADASQLIGPPSSPIGLVTHHADASDPNQAKGTFPLPFRDWCPLWVHSLSPSVIGARCGYILSPSAIGADYGYPGSASSDPTR
eukprot:1195184-Prorocentrum_minimum.AAC.3